MDGGASFAAAADESLEGLSALQQRLEARLGLMAEALCGVQEDVGALAGLCKQAASGKPRGVPEARGTPGATGLPRSRGDLVELRCPHEVWDTPSASEDLATGASNWPQTVVLRPCFAEALGMDSGHPRSLVQPASVKVSMFNVESASLPGSEQEEESLKRPHFTERYIIGPHSRNVLMFKAFSVLILLCDLVMVPYMLAWKSPYEGWMFAAMLFSALFWVLDMGSKFITGYVKDYHVQMRPMDIVMHYVRTRFLLDLLFVCSDCCSLAVLYSAGAPGAPWIFHAMRVLKAGRLLHIRSLLNESAIIITDEKYHSSMMFAVVIAGALWLNHLMSCAWHALGTRANSDTWLYWVETVGIDYAESSELYQYLSSLHWSVATFLGGNVEIYCRNSSERAVSIGYTMAGLVYVSVLISLLSAALVDRNEAMKQQTHRLVTLRRYLRERKVNQRIAILVQQQVTERIGKKEQLTEREVESSMGYLSKALRYELRLDMFRRYITTHPLFGLWFDMDKRALQLLCAETLGFSDLRAADELFTAGAEAGKAYHLIRGSLQYSRDHVGMARGPGGSTRVEPEAWLSEACLWAEWKHAGTAEALETSQVLSVTGEGISQAMVKNPHVQEITVEYCRLFHQAIVSARPPEAYPDDLQVPHAEFSNLVLNMDRDIQVTVGLHAIAKMRVQIGVGLFRINLPGQDDKLEALRKEVESGKSTVMVNARGEVERFVSLVAVRLLSEDKLLVQLAKQEKAQDFLVECALPAQKKPLGLSVEESLSKILAEKLTDFLGDAEPAVQNIPQPEERVEESKLFGINTKYLRYVCTVRVESGDDSVAAMATRWRPTESTDTAASIPGPGRRSSQSAQLAEEMGPHRGLLDRKVHPVGADGKMTWYAWVTEDEFAFLKRAEVKPLLRSWLALHATDLGGRPLQGLMSDATDPAVGFRASMRRVPRWQMADQAAQSAGSTAARARATAVPGGPPPLSPRRSGCDLPALAERSPEEPAVSIVA